MRRYSHRPNFDTWIDHRLMKTNPKLNSTLNRRGVLTRYSTAAASMAGSLTLTGLLPDPLSAAAPPIGTHHTPLADRVIFLFMHGGFSQVDTFDYKPKLEQNDGGDLPFDLPANLNANKTLARSPWRFRRRGDSGLWVSDLLPHMADVADDLCVIKSMHTRGQSHGQAVGMVNTGSDNLVRPSMGAWISYALGGGHPDLPAHVSIAPATAHGGPRNYGSSFLPAMHTASVIGRNGDPGSATFPHLDGPTDDDELKRRIDLIQAFNANHLRRSGRGSTRHANRSPKIRGGIDALDLASRMRSVAPGVFDLDGETDATRRAYGIGEKSTDRFGRSCLLARRLAESGVRFIGVSSGQVWDQHGKLRQGHQRNADATDRPTAALIADLKRRGMLDRTLIVWGSEFGRTPVLQGKDGRDHNPQGFSMVLCGGGVRGGITYGETDEYGYHAAVDRVHMHDLHATILHVLGIDHRRLTYRYAGRDFRLTDVAGNVVRPILTSV